MFKFAGNSGAAFGAAAFALGLVFAAPQAAVASAAPAGSQSADGAAQADVGSTADAAQSAATGKASRGPVSRHTVSPARRPAASTPVRAMADAAIPDVVSPDAPTLTPVVAQNGSDTAPVTRTAGRRAARAVPVAPANSSVPAAVPVPTPTETATATTSVVIAKPETASAQPVLVPRASSAASVTSPLIRTAPTVLPTPAAATALTSAPAVSALAAKNSLATASANPLGDFVNGLLLMISRAFNNRVPTASPKVAMVRPDGQVWGLIAGADPDGDPLTYGIKNAPKYGSVTVDGYGVYTYTPGAAFTGTDSFTATVTDGVFHLNLVNLLNGGKTSVNVTVNAKAADPSGTVSDTFGGSAGSRPNSQLWNIATGAYVDSGVQTYTASTDNVRLDGEGHLVLQARKTADGFTSGEVTTKGKLDTTYGTTTARIKFPAGQGIWPAFWMLGSTYSFDTWDAPGPTGWPGCGEIDIMELVNTGTTYHVALHGPRAGDGADYLADAGGFVGATGPIGDLTTAYHDYWVIRAPNLIVVGVDGNRLVTLTPASLPADGTWVFEKPFYTTLNLAVGGTWPGPPDATTPWPSTMLVDSFKYTPLA